MGRSPGAEAARVAPDYTYPKRNPQATVEVTLVRFRTPALAQSANRHAWDSTMRACIGGELRHYYQRRDHRPITTRWTRLPTWVTPNRVLGLTGYTETVRIAGYKTPVIHYLMTLRDAKDPRISWALAFTDYGQSALVPLFRRLINAAEDYPHTI